MATQTQVRCWFCHRVLTVTKKGRLPPHIDRPKHLCLGSGQNNPRIMQAIVPKK